MSTVLNWDWEECLHLLTLYRNNPVMWNPQHVDYYNQKKKREIWESFAQTLGHPMKEVKRKMFSLIGGMKKEVTKQRTGVNGRKYQSRWYAFEAMAFLRNRKSRDPTKEFIDDDDTSLPDDEEHQTSGDSEEDIDEQPRVDVDEQPRVDVDEALALLKSTAAELRASGRLDNCSTYGDHIANKLRGYDNRTRTIVEHHINNILFQAGMGNFENATQPSVPLAPVPSISSTYINDAPLTSVDPSSSNPSTSAMSSLLHYSMSQFLD